MAGDDTIESVKADIERARVSLAQAVDQIAYRTSPKRMAGKAKAAAVSFARSPRGKAVLAGSGAVVAVLIARRIAKR